MSTFTVHLSDSLAERLEREAKRRCVPAEAIVRQALEEAIPVDDSGKEGRIFERLSRLMVSDPESPTDLSTNKAHMEGFGAARSS